MPYPRLEILQWVILYLVMLGEESELSKIVDELYFYGVFLVLLTTTVQVTFIHCQKSRGNLLASVSPKHTCACGLRHPSG